MTMLSNFERLTDWIQPGNVGNTGGGSNAPNGKFKLTQAVPCIVSAKGAGPYNNGYFYRDIPGAWNAITFFSYRLKFRLPTAADYDACQAIEFELQQNVGGKIYNMAWQADLKGPNAGFWSTFDYNLSQWVPTTIPANIPLGKWLAVEATCLRGADGTLTHLALTLNGTTYPVNVTRPATPKAENDYVHAAFQLDSDARATPYMCELSDVGVTMLPTST